MRLHTTNKWLCIALVLHVASLSAVNAQDGASSAPATPPAVNNYAPYPQPDAGYVTDLAGLLTRTEQERIEQWLWQVESSSGVEVIVVIINSIGDYPGTANADVESFARGLFDAYGVGNLPKNDGVLLLVARRDRKARIELGQAYARTRDADARAIMDRKIIPAFKNDDYARGITDGVKAITLEFANVRIGWNWPLVVSLVAIPVVGAVAVSLFRSGKRGWGWVTLGVIVVLILVVVRILSMMARHAAESDSSSWSSGGFGGGFGGGSSGGGGATGSW